MATDRGAGEFASGSDPGLDGGDIGGPVFAVPHSPTRAGEGAMDTSTPWAERLAAAFHEAYERQAPEHGYETRSESAVAWEQVPETNRKLMVAVVEDVFEHVGWLNASPDDINDGTYDDFDFAKDDDGGPIDLYGYGTYRPARVFTAWANEDERV